MASEMVERLAERWSTETGSLFASEDARWWINTIADELEDEADRIFAEYPNVYDGLSPGIELPKGTHGPLTYTAISQWLRTQAKKPKR